MKNALCLNRSKLNTLTYYFVRKETYPLSVAFFVKQLLAWKASSPNNVLQRVSDHDDTAPIQKGILGGLEKYTQYTVAVVAYNGAGDSPRSDTLIIRTEEGGTCCIY